MVNLLQARITTQGTYYLTYDQENHLTGVSGAATATFVYDGDGNRVKGTVNGVTTTYIGSHFEWTGSTTTAKKYYYAGSTRVAMREGTTLYYLLGDHLGSTSLTLTSTGGLEGEVRYGAWGADRYVDGASHTSYRYTGQRSESGIGLYYYGARWYDSSLGRFIQADTIVPLASQGVQAWDRYAGMNNNPVKYIDPSGHGAIDPGTGYYYVDGWNDDYLQKQRGNTCAVLAYAVAISIVTGTKLTQDDVQPTFGNTYAGIGVIPAQQMILDLDRTLELTSSQGNRQDIIDSLNNDLPVVVSLAFSLKDGLGHAITAVGYIPGANSGDPVEILFYNPATGKIEPESLILSSYDFKRGFATFDALWGASNIFIPHNSMVTVRSVPHPDAPPIPGGGGGGGSIPGLGNCMR